MRPYILAETNWEALKNAQIDLAVLPWGATEAHNFHLPYATDCIEAERIAAESARLAWEKGGNVIVLPVVPFGVNTGQTDIYLDINLNPSTQLAMLHDIIQVLDRQGIHKLMVLNSHGGNDFNPLLRELGLRFPSMYLCVTNWFRMPGKEDYFEAPGDHADEMETSLMLYFRPELVLPPEKWGPGTENKHKLHAFGEGWVWSERKWSQVTADTGIGNPKAASAEKGEAFFRYITDKMGTLMYDLTRLDAGTMYGNEHHES